MNEQIDDVEICILNERGFGFTTFKVIKPSSLSSGSITDILDRFVQTLGFKGLGEQWVEMNRSDAQTMLTKLLHKDLAYGSEIMTYHRARRLSNRFVRLFGDEARYFTNTKYINSRRSWSPITKSTFDAGIICVDEEHIGIAWVEDED